MEQELISKRELLELYEISYGALYRWKRRGLIPEEWFIKMSAPTGQETYFPRELICERVELIKKQKADVSLDELSSRLSDAASKNSTLTVDTVYGKRTFLLSEVKSVVIDDGNGKIANLNLQIKGE